MSESVGIVENVLSGNVSAEAGERLLERTLEVYKNENQREYSRHTCLYRLCRAINHESWYDVSGHLRQSILTFKQHFLVGGQIAEKIKKFTSKFCLFIDEQNEVGINGGYPKWLDESGMFKKLYDFQESLKDKHVFGDAMLLKMTNFIYYKSREQKIIIQACLNMPAGSTLLACLPTGGGKSLVGQMPAFLATEGGALGGAIDGSGTTIVIVPTVALALDQAESSQKYFIKADNNQYYPKAYHSGLTDEEKSLIFNEVKNGNVPLLYISPEAILNGPLNQILIDPAFYGKLNQLIIDEAHIVVDWGNSFRPEFQLLSSFRRRLLQASQGNLKTILLSATLTDWTTDILKDLFSEGNNLVEVRADALRTEPMYWLDTSLTEEGRVEKICELLPLLPRPIILYVTNPSKAEAWKEVILKQGFINVKTFTGDTIGTDREEKLNEWNDNKIDIMVATSAFGMGVDKPDIRTIIHCCLPDSINRFYQEVGRGGRDGFPSISLLSFVPKIDLTEAFSLVRPSVLTAKKMVARLNKMMTTSKRRENGDTFWVDTDSRPSHLQNDKTGKRSARHNEATLLFFHRRGLIDILGMEMATADLRRQLLIKLNDIEFLDDSGKFMKHLEPIRKDEQEHIFDVFNKMVALTTNFNQCWSNAFTEIYPYVEPRCGSCPWCRIHRIRVNKDNAIVTIKGKELLETNHGQIYGNLKRYLGLGREMLLYLDKANQLIVSEEMFELVLQLINSGVSNIILPTIDNKNLRKLVERMPYNKICFFYGTDEIVLNPSIYSISGVLGILYSGKSDIDNEINNWVQGYISDNPHNQVIHIAPLQTEILREQKMLSELVNSKYSMKLFINQNTSEGLLG